MKNRKRLRIYMDATVETREAAIADVGDASPESLEHMRKAIEANPRIYREWLTFESVGGDVEVEKASVRIEVLGDAS